ncbi:MAG: glycogen/starch synthase [Bacteroidales bacterium]|nr:glycogen/starch synthase [Candidatus Colimorpha onthohippi]
MAKGRILYVNQEIAPYSPETPNAILGRYLPEYVQNHDREIRVFMPRFSFIKERNFQLHEVIRLSGMNLIVNNCDHQLIIKVGSIPSAHMQVYFIDNEEYFTKCGNLVDESNLLQEDSDERILFFGRGTLEAVRKLAWQPHLVHFTGWFSCMIPFYMRRINKENAFFKDTSTVFTITNDPFNGKFRQEIDKKLKNDGATAKDSKLFQDLDYMNLCKAAITYANGIVIGGPDANPELVEFARQNKKPRVIVDYNEDRDTYYTQINKLYDYLIGSSINQ